jgi:FkbM family methyltransferase
MTLLTRAFQAVPPSARHRALAVQYMLNEPELRRISEFVPADAAALDVGAWWGPWTYWLSRRVTEVHTFEPVPHMAAFLREVTRPNVTIHNLALSDTAGSAVLHVPSGGQGSEGRSTLHEPPFSNAQEITVALTPLDDVDLPPRIGFIKVDVEGHEMQVLQGAVKTITTHRPNLLIEVESHDDRLDRVDEVVDFLGELGYSASFIRGRKWAPFAEFDLERDQLRLAATVRRRGLLSNTLFTRGYVNNFLFRPS